MADIDNGHLTTKATSFIMEDILSNDDTYDILLSFGDSWKEQQYMNTKTGNIFLGEPKQSNTTFKFTKKYKNLKWGITYSFKGTRNNKFVSVKTGKVKKYGASHMTMDRLYYILINTYNDGVDFIQEYLNKVATHHLESRLNNLINPVLDVLNQTAKEDKKKFQKKNSAKITKSMGIIKEAKKHMNKKGLVDGRFKIGGIPLRFLVRQAENRIKNYEKKLNKFTHSSKTWYNESSKVEKFLKEDFINSMNSGIVPLRKKVLSAKTLRERMDLGFNNSLIFVASSQFINSIVFKVRITNAK